MRVTAATIDDLAREVAEQLGLSGGAVRESLSRRPGDRPSFPIVLDSDDDAWNAILRATWLDCTDNAPWPFTD